MMMALALALARRRRAALHRRCRALLASLILVAAALACLPASAKLAPELQLDRDAREQLRRIEESLNEVRTVRARFQQNSSNGENAQGDLYLERPGRLRVDYQPPAEMLVIADGTFLVYYDRKLEQVSYIPLNSTPAGILLDERFSLEDEALLITSFERGPGTISIEVARTAEKSEGSILLIFSDKTMTLRQWAVTDAQGVTTLVTLIDPEFNGAIEPSTFVFKDPRLTKGISGRHSP